MSAVLHALRSFSRTPGITIIALLSIAISIGATAVVFTAVKSVLIEPLPYANAGELVQLRTDYARLGPSHADWVFWPDMQDVAKATRTLESLGLDLLEMSLKSVRKENPALRSQAQARRRRALERVKEAVALASA